MSITRNAALAAELRAEKARQNMSGRELARRVHKPETTVARYLRGETDMSLDDIEQFARALGVTTVDLIMRSYQQTPPSPFSPAPGLGAGQSAAPRRNNPCYSREPVTIGSWKRGSSHIAAA